MQFKFAMLDILARRPGGCARLEELLDELEMAGVRGGDQHSEFDRIDVFQAGLVVTSETGELKITDAGRSVVEAIAARDTPDRKAGKEGRPHSLRMIDELIGLQMRQQIFDLEPRAPDEIPDLGLIDDADPPAKTGPDEPEVVEPPEDLAPPALATDQADALDEVEPEDTGIDGPGIFETMSDADHEAEIDVEPDQTFVRSDARDLDTVPEDDVVAPHPALPAPADEPAPRAFYRQNDQALDDRLPAFLSRTVGAAPPGQTRTSFARSGIGTRNAGSGRLPKRLRSFGQRSLALLRGHVREDLSTVPNRPRASQAGLGGMIVVILSLLLVVLGLGAVLAINQIRMLRSEIALLEQKLVSARKPEPAKAPAAGTSASPQAAARNEVQPGPGPANRPAAPRVPSLVLNADEIRIIREYIKPAPSAGAGAVIGVGDTVTGGTIPLPSALTDRVPKLLGARFTIRNGEIVILSRGSQKADAILQVQ